MDSGNTRERPGPPVPAPMAPLNPTERDELIYLRAQTRQLTAQTNARRHAYERYLIARDNEPRRRLTINEHAQNAPAQLSYNGTAGRTRSAPAALDLGRNEGDDGRQVGLVAQTPEVPEAEEIHLQRGPVRHTSSESAAGQDHAREESAEANPPRHGTIQHDPHEHDRGSSHPPVEAFDEPHASTNGHEFKQRDTNSPFNGTALRSRHSTASATSYLSLLAKLIEDEGITHFSLSPPSSDMDSESDSDSDSDADDDGDSVRPSEPVHSTHTTRTSVRVAKPKPKESRRANKADNGRAQRTMTPESEHNDNSKETTDADSPSASDYDDGLPPARSQKTPKTSTVLNIKPLPANQQTYDTPSGTRSRTLLPGWTLPETASFKEADLMKNNGVAWICGAKYVTHGPAPGHTLLQGGARRGCTICKQVRSRYGVDMDFSLPPMTKIEVDYLPGQWEYTGPHKGGTKRTADRLAGNENVKKTKM